MPKAIRVYQQQKVTFAVLATSLIKYNRNRYPGSSWSVDRCHGIERLLTLKELPVEAILLDDAFQISIRESRTKYSSDRLFHRLFCDDTLDACGRFTGACTRQKSSTQIVIVTKCPPISNPLTTIHITKRLNLFPYQQLLYAFSVFFRYGNPCASFLIKATVVWGERKIIFTDRRNRYLPSTYRYVSPDTTIRTGNTYTKHRLTALERSSPFLFSQGLCK